MKKIYKKAEIKIVEFASEDIMAANFTSQSYGSLNDLIFSNENGGLNILDY